MALHATAFKVLVAGVMALGVTVAISTFASGPSDPPTQLKPGESVVGDITVICTDKSIANVKQTDTYRKIRVGQSIVVTYGFGQKKSGGGSYRVKCGKEDPKQKPQEIKKPTKPKQSGPKEETG